MGEPSISARRMAGGVLLVCATAIACAGPGPTPNATRSATPPAAIGDGIPLPGTAPWPAPPATPPACAGVGLDAILHGDAADPRVTWLADRAGGGRVELTWPIGFRARFTPTLVVIDPAGRAVHREGDAIDGGCVDGDRILLGYP